MTTKRLDEFGQEIPDPVPVAIPAGFKRPETLAEQVQRLVRTQISRDAAMAGAETFDEANDFDVGDDDDPRTPYETFFDPVLGKEFTAEEFKRHEQALRQRYVKAQEEHFSFLDRQRVLQRMLNPDAPQADQETVAKQSGRRKPTPAPKDDSDEE